MYELICPSHAIVQANILAGHASGYLVQDTLPGILLDGLLDDVIGHDEPSFSSSFARHVYNPYKATYG
jgi:hypothetical protein